MNVILILLAYTYQFKKKKRFYPQWAKNSQNRFVACQS